jgi:hypothetical protein
MLVFAAVILMMNGFFAILEGLVALISPHRYFATAGGSLFLFDLTGWGWFVLIMGIVLLIAGGALLTGALWARVLAVIIAVVSALGQLLLLPAQPWWSMIVIAVDVLVIYAVIAHGRELRPSDGVPR